MTAKSANQNSILSDKILIIYTLFVEEGVKLNASFVDNFCHQLALLSDDIFDNESFDGDDTIRESEKVVISQVERARQKNEMRKTS